MLKDLIIFEKAYTFTLWIYAAASKFPKQQRFVLGQQLGNASLEVLRGIIRANAARNKAPLLYQLSVDLDTLRIFIRLAHDLRFLSGKQYVHAAERVNEIGKLLGGWMKKNMPAQAAASRT